MSNKCHFVFLNGNIYLFIFILVKNVFLILMMPNTLTLWGEGINWPLWHRSVKNLPSNGWFNYSNNGIKHYFIKENHTLYWVPQNSRNSMGQCQLLLENNERNN
jgi:hypothetical protein